MIGLPSLKISDIHGTKWRHGECVNLSDCQKLHPQSGWFSHMLGYTYYMPVLLHDVFINSYCHWFTSSSMKLAASCASLRADSANAAAVAILTALSGSPGV